MSKVEGLDLVELDLAELDLVELDLVELDLVELDLAMRMIPSAEAVGDGKVSTRDKTIT